MTWGARSLVTYPAIILLFQVLPLCAAATRRNSPTGATRGAYAAAEPADRGKRESDSMPDIFIEHVNDEDGDSRFFPLLVAITVVGGLIAVALLLLACHLLLRLAESQCCKCRYHRLRRDDSDIGHRLGKKRTEGQAFTYVDLSYNECAHLDHDDEEKEAPRFSVSHHTARKIEADDVHLRRDQGSHPVTVGSPFGGEDVTESTPVRAERAEDSAKNMVKAATTATNHPYEPPKKKLCAQHIGRVPGSGISGPNDEEGFNEYEERCAQYKSAAPEFEINIRDRLIRRCAHGGIVSPRGSSVPRTEAGVVPGVWSETNQAYYRDVDSTHWHRHARIWSSNSSPPQNLHETAGTSVSLGAVNSPMPDNSVAQKTTSCVQRGSSMSGHGRYYEERAHGEKDNRDVASASKFLKNPDVDYVSTMQDRPTAVLPSSSHEPIVNALVELPETRVVTYSDPSAPSLKPAKPHRSVEDQAPMAGKAAALAQKEPKASSALGSPMHLDMTLTLAGMPSPQSSGQGTPQASGSNEMRVQVPKMIAYFDTPQTVQRLNAKSDGSNADCSVQNRSRFPEIPSKDTAKEVSVSLTSLRKTIRADETVQLPEPPTDQCQKQLEAEPSFERSARTTGTLHSERRQHDVHDSTEPFSVDDASQQRASGSELLSATDMSAGQVDVASSPSAQTAVDSRSSLALIHAQPSVETPPVAHVKRSVSLFTQNRPKVAESTSSLPRNEPDRESAKRSRDAEVPDLPTLPTGGEYGHPESHVEKLEKPTKAAATLVSPTRTPQSRKFTSSQASNHVDGMPLPDIPSPKQNEAAHISHTAGKDGSMQHFVNSEDYMPAKMQTSGMGSTHTGGKQPTLTLPPRDAEPSGQGNLPPTTISMDGGEADRTMKGSLKVNFNTTEANGMKQKSAEDRSPGRPEKSTRFPNRNDAARVEKAVSSDSSHPSEWAGTLETEVAGEPVVSNGQPSFVSEKEDPSGAEISKTKSSVEEKPVIAEKPQLLYNDRRGEEPRAVRGSVKPGLGGKSAETFSTPSPPQAPAIRNVPRQVALHGPVSNLQHLESTAVMVGGEHKVPEENHTVGPFNDSNRRVSDSSAPLKQVGSRFNSNNRRRSLDYSSSSEYRDTSLETTNNSSSWDQSSKSRHFGSTLSLPSSTGHSHRSRDDFIGTHSMTTFLSDPLFVDKGEDNAKRKVAPSRHVQSGAISNIDSAHHAVVSAQDKFPALLAQNDITTISSVAQPLTSSAPQQGPDSINAAQYLALHRNSLQEPNAITELPHNERALLDSSVTSSYRRNADSGGKLQPHSINHEPTGSVGTLGSPNRKILEDQRQRESAVVAVNEDRFVTPAAPPESKTIRSRWPSKWPPVEIAHGEISSIGRQQGEVISSDAEPVVAHDESMSLVDVGADRRALAALKPQESGLASFPSSELINRPEVSAVQPAFASGTLVTSDRRIASRDITATSAVTPIQGSDKDMSVAPYSDHRVVPSGTNIASEASRSVATGGENGLTDRAEVFAVQPAVASGTLVTSDRSISARDITATSTVIPTEGSNKEKSVAPYSGHRVSSDAQIVREASRTVATRGESGLAIEQRDDTTAVARAVIPSRRFEDTSVVPHREPSVPSDLNSSQVSVTEKISASPAVVPERTSPVPAHDSKDLIKSQTDRNRYARLKSPRENRADAENPKPYKARPFYDDDDPEPFTK